MDETAEENSTTVDLTPEEVWEQERQRLLALLRTPDSVIYVPDWRIPDDGVIHSYASPIPPARR